MGILLAHSSGKEDIYESRDIDGGSICVCDRG
jgi:hypothetical protein